MNLSVFHACHVGLGLIDASVEEYISYAKKLWRHDIRQNDTCYNDTHQNDIKQNNNHKNNIK